MQKLFKGALLLSLATQWGCDQLSGGLNALEKATYAEAVDGTGTDAVTDSPAADGASTSLYGPHAGPPPLIMDCSLVASRERVVQRNDQDGDGQLSPDEEAALSDEFGSNGQPPPGDGMMPPPNGGGRGQGGSGGPGGEGGQHHGQRPPGGGPNGGEGFQCVDGQDAGTPSDAPPPPPPGHGRGMWKHLEFIYDADESGSLDETEKAALEADLTTGCNNRNAALLARFDSNADGTLDSAEETAAQDALKAEWEARFAQERVTADANGDGTLSCEERQALFDAHRAEMEAHRASVDAQFDVDGSGDLDATERAALREFLKEKVRSGVPPGQEPPAAN